MCRDRYSAPSSTSGSRAHAHASYLLSVPPHRSSYIYMHRFSLKDAGPKRSQHCGPPDTYDDWRQRIVHGQIGGSRGWNSALERRPRVRTSGGGSSSSLSSSFVREVLQVHTSLQNTHRQKQFTLTSHILREYSVSVRRLATGACKRERGAGG